MNNNISIPINRHQIKGVIENAAAKKLVILIHGFTGDCRGPDDIFIKLSKQLQSNGFAVLRFSFTGTPPSNGDYAQMTLESQAQELEQVINYAKSQGYNQISLLGESMGGAVITKLQPTEIESIVFWYSVFEFADSSFKDYLTTQSAQIIKTQGYLEIDGFHIGQTFISQIPDINLYQDLKCIFCPTLLLHGEADTDVPYQQTLKASKHLQAPYQVQIIKGANHCFRNEQSQVINITVNFFIEQTKS